VELRRAVVNRILKSILDILCKVDNREFYQTLSKCKPLLIVTNHINFLEVPIFVTHSYPMYLTGIVKLETWNNPLFAFLFNTYNAIPINRKGAFREAFQKARVALDEGYFVAIAPEGVRSKNGALGRARAGIIELAIDADVPVLPVVHYGGEHIWENMRRFRRTKFNIKPGRPFRIKFEGRPDKETRGEMLGEVMGQMAKLLPEEMRGIYAQHAEQECKHLEFLE